MLEVQNLLYGLLAKYHGSLNNPSRANGDLAKQIFAHDCNKSGETEEVDKSNMLVSIRNNHEIKFG